MPKYSLPSNIQLLIKDKVISYISDISEEYPKKYNTQYQKWLGSHLYKERSHLRALIIGGMLRLKNCTTKKHTRNGWKIQVKSIRNTTSRNENQEAKS